MSFQTLYDVTQTPALHYFPICMALLFSVPGIAGLYLWKSVTNTGRIVMSGFVFLALAQVGAVWMIYARHESLVADVRAGHAKTVEGQIKDVVDTRSQHHFTVNGVTFQASSGALWINDYPTKINWSHISLPVRITYADKSLITKFEIQGAK